MNYRTNKEWLLAVLSDWNEFLSRRIYLIACGGTALTLLGIKDSTMDIDLKLKNPYKNGFAWGIPCFLAAVILSGVAVYDKSTSGSSTELGEVVGLGGVVAVLAVLGVTGFKSQAKHDKWEAENRSYVDRLIRIPVP